MNRPEPVYIIHHIPKTGGVSLRNWLARHLGMHQGLVHYGVAGELYCMQHGLPFLEQMTAAQRRGVRVVMGHYVTEATAEFFPDREIRRLIVLREPVQRLVSQYNHAMNFWCQGLGRAQIGFQEWFERHAVETYDYKDAIRRQGMTPELAFRSQASLGPDYMARFIAQNFRRADWPALAPTEFAARVNTLLGSFWGVGLTERLDDLAAGLGHALGIPADLPHANQGGRRGVYLQPDAALIEWIQARNPADRLVYAYWKTRLEAAG